MASRLGVEVAEEPMVNAGVVELFIVVNVENVWW